VRRYNNNSSPKNTNSINQANNPKLVVVPKDQYDISTNSKIILKPKELTNKIVNKGNKYFPINNLNQNLSHYDNMLKLQYRMNNRFRAVSANVNHKYFNNSAANNDKAPNREKRLDCNISRENSPNYHFIKKNENILPNVVHNTRETNLVYNMLNNKLEKRSVSPIGLYSKNMLEYVSNTNETEFSNPKIYYNHIHL